MIFGWLAIALYLGCFAYQVAQLRKRQTYNKTIVIGLGIAGLISHGIAAVQQIYGAQGLELGYFNVSSLIFWVVCTILILSSLKKPVENLLLPLLPASAIAIFLSITFKTPFKLLEQLSPQITGHILLSILAYSMLTIATIQAILLAYQEYQLQHHHTRSLIRIFPPIQTMEALLFEMLWVGVMLLTASLVSGFLFIEDIFEQHLAHKVFFSMAAWVIFCWLLWGRYQLGWRSQTAARFTIGGFILLMLAFLGSKLVLELVLQRG